MNGVRGTVGGNDPYGTPIDTLVLLPGLNNTQAVFDGVVAALPAGLAVHAPNNPALDTVEAIAQTHLAALPERFWLAGFSFGGYVALAMLEAAPERVLGLALVCTAPFADTPEQSQKRLTSLEAARQGRYFEQVAAQAPNAFHPDSLANQALMDARHAMVMDYGVDRYIAHIQATAARPDRSHLFDGRHPVLVVGASHDKVFAPDTLKLWAQRIASARFEQVQAAGHLLPMEQPKALAQILTRWMHSPCD